MNFFITIILLLYSFKSYGWTLISSDPLQRGWDKNEIEFKINFSTCDIDRDHLIEGFNNAAKFWNHIVTANILIKYGGPTLEVDKSSSPVILCDSSLKYTEAIGYAVIYSDKTIKKGAIILNSSGNNKDIKKWSKTKISNVITHEMGHVLGIGHSRVKDSIMYSDRLDNSNINYIKENNKEKTLRGYCLIGEQNNMAKEVSANINNVNQELKYPKADDWSALTYLYPINELDGFSAFGCSNKASASDIKYKNKRNELQDIVNTIFIILLAFFSWIAFKIKRFKN